MTVREVRRQRLTDLEVGPAATRTWWAIEADVGCPYCEYRGWVGLTYSAPAEYPQDDLERLHEHVWRGSLEDPWLVTDETRRHRDECWSRYLDSLQPGEFGQDGVGTPVPGAGRCGTRPDGGRGPADETGGT